MTSGPPRQPDERSTRSLLKVTSLDAVIIGAGQAGLAASHHLSRRGIEHVVLERGQLGETWRSQRWDTFALNTPRWMNRLPGEPDDARDRDAFLTASAWVAGLEAAAKRDLVPIRERTLVTAVRPRRSGGFVVHAEDGQGATAVEARAVIVASGMLNVPRIPGFASMLPPEVQQLSAAAYRRPTDLRSGAVLVVGSAQSGVQISEDLVLAGRTVYLATSRVGRVRRRYRGRDTFEWLVMAGFWEGTAAGLPHPDMLGWPNPQTSGVGARGHTVSLQSLEALGVRLLGRPARVRGDRIELDDTLGEAIAFGDRIALELTALADRAIDDAGIRAPVAEPDPADAPHPDPGGVHSAPEIDLEASGVSTIIWATGFGGDLAFLPGDALDEFGRPIHVRGIGALRDLYYIGLPWMTKRKSGIIHGLDEDGAAIVTHIAARLAGS